LSNSLVLDQVIEALHAPLGDLILRAWGFPAELSHIPSEHVDFQRDAPKADYADIVTVAMLQSYMGSDNAMGKVDYHQVKAFDRLGLDADIQHAESEDQNDEMEAAMALLN